MNLNPFAWFARPQRVKAAQPGATVMSRSTNPQGPWTSALSNWSAREVSPHLYEAMREACPPIDAAIDRLTTLDGILRVETETDRLANAIQDWMDNVRVNDMQHGLQTFYAGQSNEMYEQGFTVGGYRLTGNNVDRLRVYDSKGVVFHRVGNVLQTWYAPPARPAATRHDGTQQLERLLRNPHPGTTIASLLADNGYRRLAPGRLIYASRAPEADNPYGTSIMRSTEFVTRLIATMDNSLLHVWERFGTPSFVVTYQAGSRKTTEAELATRQGELASMMADAATKKRDGHAVDVVNAIGADDKLSVGILGGDGQVLEIEAPARHVLEQIVAKTGLPSWMLGFHWSTAERLAQRQGELALQESRTRFSARKPALDNLLATMLRALGYTWEPGDWQLVQDLPNLQDLVAVAQAGFLEAQTELMRSNTGAAGATADQSAQPAQQMTMHPDGRMEWRIKSPPGVSTAKQADTGGASPGESAAENGDQLARAERSALLAISRDWSGLQTETFAVLGLSSTNKALKADASVFSFDADTMLAALLGLQDEFVSAVGAEDGDYLAQLYTAWAVGVSTAAEQVDAQAMADAARRRYLVAVADQGLAQVRDTAVRVYAEDIVASLRSGVYDGENPADVARELRERFDVREYDWKRLARSEITQAHAVGKMDQYAELEVERYDYVTAGDARVSTICRGLAAGGPYVVGQGPLPMRDSHPNCRCTVVARADDG